MTIASLQYSVKYFTFDRSIIKRNWRKMNETPLKKAGLIIRRIARNSIRRRAYGNASAPGTPPHSHKPGKNPPFKQIYSVPDYFGTEVVIGMVGYNKRGGAVPVPGIQEHGLAARRWIDTQFGKKKSKNKVQLNKQQKIAIRRKKIQKGIIRQQTINYKPRPFMNPALMRSMPSLPQLWRGSLGGRSF